MVRHNVLYLTSELYPFAKVGGLADVAGALPKVLKDLEHDVRVFIPKYKLIRDRKYNLREVIRLRDIQVPLGDTTVTVSVKSGFVPDSKVQAYFLEYKPFFDRKGIYVNPETGEGWGDDAQRFSLFAKAALETLKVLYWQPDIIHVNDWPGAMLPYFLKNDYASDELFANSKTVLTIHNMAYQGTFPADTAESIFGKDVSFDESHPAWHNGEINFLKCGIETADVITTVSPTYAEQIMTPEFGAGLDSVISARRDNVVGLLNGIDTTIWTPEKDKHIETSFSVEEMDGKAESRAALCSEAGFAADDNRMIAGMISRIAGQKGFDLLLNAIDRLLEQDVNLVILGKGEKEIEEKLVALQEAHAGRISVTIGQNEKLAHMIEAGADAFLMPSVYEPCGLNQMYSLAYGTAPIVHATGGLSDTVQEFDGENGNGFRFDEFTEDALVDAVSRAANLFKDGDKWTKLVANAMNEDHSWMATAEKLLNVYTEVAEEAIA